MWCKRVGIYHKTQSTWTAYRLSTGCRRRGRRQLSPHEPAWESGDTKAGGYRRDRSRLVPLYFFSGPARRHSPVEGSVRLVLEHLVEVFQRFHLTCCLAGEYTASLNLSRVLDEGWEWRRLTHSPWCQRADLSQRDQREFLQKKRKKKRFDHKLVLFLSTVILGWDCDYLCFIHHQPVPLSEYLWPDDECTSMNLGLFSSRTLLSCRTASL